ncbi:TRAP transporter small permease [Puniceibacterium sediminis]|uniref:TRAP transporter small permease protein n=1 Tax=Puniceibacterium sediminis TaxID=1608407 RepID=A0A238V201_9RHOB|nr:TRAP transporter small permease [Puniceibacterium sediminis]SNR28455.1 C4-dicarboxylate transporter, DctQ subunit [Puniceibacterium sediminis]
MSGKYTPKGPVGRVVHGLEETAIAVILGLMTMLTFVNVIMRYAFNSSIIWSLEVVLVLFTWLVLFGVSYAFKVTAHLGVDAITNMLPRGPRKVVALLAGAICVFYALLLCKGAWDQWAPFADLPPTTGHWFPTGLDTAARGRSFFETDQIPMPDWLRFLEDWINYGEHYSKLPRVVPYTILPVAAALILFRICQAVRRVWNDESESLIVSHEAEDAIEDVAAMNRGD